MIALKLNASIISNKTCFQIKPLIVFQRYKIHTKLCVSAIVERYTVGD